MSLPDDERISFLICTRRNEGLTNGSNQLEDARGAAKVNKAWSTVRASATKIAFPLSTPNTEVEGARLARGIR